MKVFRPTYLFEVFILGVILLLAATASAETGYQDSGAFALNTNSLSGWGDRDQVPQVNSLFPCHPNPFNPRTTIDFFLAGPARAQLAVYDLKGRLVKTIQEGEEVAAGFHQAVWDGLDNASRGVAGGVYLYRLSADDFSFSRRMTLVK